MKRRVFLRFLSGAPLATALVVAGVRLGPSDLALRKEWGRTLPNYADAHFVRMYQREVIRRLEQHGSLMRGFGVVRFPRTLT